MTRPSATWQRWVLTVLTAILLGLGGWAGKTLIAQGQEIPRIKDQHLLIISDQAQTATRLQRIDDKLDKTNERLDKVLFLLYQARPARAVAPPAP